MSAGGAAEPQVRAQTTPKSTMRTQRSIDAAGRRKHDIRTITLTTRWISDETRRRVVDEALGRRQMRLHSPEQHILFT